MRETAGREKLKEITTCKSLGNLRAWGNRKGVLWQHRGRKSFVHVRCPGVTCKFGWQHKYQVMSVSQAEIP